MSRLSRRSSILKSTSTLASNDNDSSKLAANTSTCEDLVPNRRRSSVGFNRRVSFSSRVVVQVFQADSERPELLAPKRSAFVDTQPSGDSNNGARTAPASIPAEADKTANADQSVYMDVENGSFYVTSDTSRRSIRKSDQREVVQSGGFAMSNTTMNMSLCSTTLIDENRNPEDTLKPVGTAHDTSDMAISNDTRHHETQLESTKQATRSMNDRSCSWPPKDLKDATQHGMVSMCISTLGEADSQICNTSDMELTVAHDRSVMQPPRTSSVKTITNDDPASQSINMSDMDLTVAYERSVMQPPRTSFKDNAAASPICNTSDMELTIAHDRTVMQPARTDSVKNNANDDPAASQSCNMSDMELTMAHDRTVMQPARTDSVKNNAIDDPASQSCNMSDMELTVAYERSIMQPRTDNAAKSTALKSLNFSMKAKSNESCMDISAVNSSDAVAMSFCTVIMKDAANNSVAKEASGERGATTSSATYPMEKPGLFTVQLKDADESNKAVFAVPTESVRNKLNASASATDATPAQKDVNLSNTQEASDMEISCMLERTQLKANAGTKVPVVAATRGQVNAAEREVDNSTMEISMMNETCGTRAIAALQVALQANQSKYEATNCGVKSKEATITDVANTEPSVVVNVPAGEGSRPVLVAPTPVMTRNIVEPVSSATVYSRMSCPAWSNESLVDFRHRPVLESTALPTPTARRFSAMNFTTPRTDISVSSHMRARERPHLIEENEVPEKMHKLDEVQPGNPAEPEDQARSSTSVKESMRNQTALPSAPDAVIGTDKIADCTNLLPVATQPEIPVGINSVPVQQSTQQKDIDALKEGSAKVVDWMLERLSESLRALDSHESDDSDSDSMIELDEGDSVVLPTASPAISGKPERFDASTSHTTINRSLSSTISTIALRRPNMAKSALDVLALLRRSVVRARENATRFDNTTNSRITTRFMDDTAGQEVDEKSRRKTFIISQLENSSDTTMATSRLSTKVRRVSLKERFQEIIRRKNAAQNIEQLHASYERFRQFSTAVSRLGSLASLTDPNANDQLSTSASYETLFAAYNNAVTADELRSICTILNDFYLPFIDKYANALRCVENAPDDADCLQFDEISMSTTVDGALPENDFAHLEHAIELFAKVHFATWKKSTLESVARSLSYDAVARFMSTRLNYVRSECAQMEDANLKLRLRIDSLRRQRQATTPAVANVQPDSEVLTFSKQRRNVADEATKLQIRKRIEELQARSERHRVDVVELSSNLEKTRARVLLLEAEANDSQGAMVDLSPFRDAILNYETQYLPWRIESLKRTDAQHYTAQLSVFQRFVQIVLSVAENDLCRTNITTPITEVLARAIASRDTVEEVLHIGCKQKDNGAMNDCPLEFMPIRKLYTQVLSALVADLKRIQVPCDARSFCSQLSRYVISYHRILGELRRVSKVAQVRLPDAQRPELVIEYCQKHTLKARLPVAALTGTVFPHTPDQLNQLITYIRQLPKQQLVRFRLTLKDFNVSAYAASYWAAFPTSCNWSTKSTNDPVFSAVEVAPMGEFSNSPELNPLFDELQGATERVRSSINNLLSNNVSRAAAVREHGLIFSLTELALASA